jgi:hypothetical protein
MAIFHRTILLLALRGLPLVAQSVLINEVQPACQQSLTDAQGGHPDWVELVCTGPSAVDLTGYTFSNGLHSHRVNGSLMLPANGHLLLFFDGRPDRGLDHVALKLPREGGTLMLIAPDGSSVIDLFTWPALPADVSIGRCPDGGRDWSLFSSASPGSSNDAGPAIRSVLAPPMIRVEHHQVVATTVPGSQVRCTMDGSAVTPESPLWSDLPEQDAAGIVRARAYAPNALPGAEAMLTLPERSGGPRISLAVDPSDLWDTERGLIGDSTHANFAESGPDRMVPTLVQFDLGMERAVRPLGLALSGSGTRGLSKRSFKLFARDRYGSNGLIELPGAGAWDEILLRADASPNAFLRNLFMEQLVRQAGANVDVQPSVPVDLILNGEPQGLYRAMPPKNGAWVKALRGAEAIELANGPGGLMLRGDRDHLDRGLHALFEGAPVDTLDQLIDLNSLIELACLDLYMGRADHDINVRCWRPREEGGRWRWILFDMDLWAPWEENSLERMCSATVPEAPYLPQLLAHGVLNARLIARLEGLLLTVLHPSNASLLADSLYATHACEMLADDSLWQGRLQRPSPAESFGELKAHLGSRPQRVIQQLAQREHRRTREVTFEAPAAEVGTVRVEDLALTPGTVQLPLLGGIPLRVKAIPAKGWAFAGWSGIDAEGPDAVIDPARCTKVRARFSREGGSGQDRL